MPNFDHLMGWIDQPQSEVQPMMATLPLPFFFQSYPSIKDSGRGKTRLLYEYVRAVTGKDIAWVQETGDCVSFGYAHGDSYLSCTEIFNGDFEEYKGPSATEFIYGGSRVTIGQGKLGSSQGSYGLWAGKFITQYGTVIRQKYEKDDLTNYDVNRATTWGYNGVPKYLLDYSRNFAIKTVSLVQTWEQYRDAIYNGYPVAICSNRGFSSVRDKDGFCYPDGSWPHCMVGVGMRDDNRPGGCLLNSWGRYMTGPVGLDCPQEAFWCDAEVLERDMLSQGDSYALSDKKGFPKKELDLRIV